MKLQIERKYVEAMVDEFPGLVALKDQLRFGNKAEVPFKQLSNAELSFLGSMWFIVGKSKVKFAHHETSRYFGGVDLNVYLVITFIYREATYDICCL